MTMTEGHRSNLFFPRYLSFCERFCSGVDMMQDSPRIGAIQQQATTERTICRQTKDVKAAAKSPDLGVT